MFEAHCVTNRGCTPVDPAGTARGRRDRGARHGLSSPLGSLPLPSHAPTSRQLWLSCFIPGLDGSTPPPRSQTLLLQTSVTEVKSLPGARDALLQLSRPPQRLFRSGPSRKDDPNASGVHLRRCVSLHSLHLICFGEVSRNDASSPAPLLTPDSAAGNWSPLFTSHRSTYPTRYCSLALEDLQGTQLAS